MKRLRPALRISSAALGGALGAAYLSACSFFPIDPMHEQTSGGSSAGLTASGGLGAPECGNGVKEGTEECDGEDFGDGDCVSDESDAGKLTCTLECQVDDSACFDLPDELEGTWAYRKPITIAPGTVLSDLNMFPVLVTIDDPEFFEHARADGRDVVFADVDGKDLPYERELYDPVAHRFAAWVLLPVLRSIPATTFHVYYGSSSSSDHSVSAQVFSYGFEAVWHLSEATQDELDTGTSFDSTGHGHQGAQRGNQQAVGKIASGQAFDGVDDEIVVSKPTTVVLGQADYTVSAWVRTSSAGSMGVVIKSDPYQHEDGDKLFGLNHNEVGEVGVDHGWVGFLGTNGAAANGAWHHLVWVQDHDEVTKRSVWTLYVDGQLIALKSDMATKLDKPHHTLRLGGRSESSNFSGFFAGRLDEVRISHFVRDEAWIGASYLSQNDPENFAQVGAEQPL
ncbi:MAG: LamG-like jellyroll fold domain-containing protein [Polyangiaceae bacterium]